MMKKALRAVTAIGLVLFAVFAANLIGTVVFTHIALSGTTSPDFQEELAPGSSLSEIIDHSLETTANDIRKTYRECSDNAPAGIVWKQSFLRVVRGMHITDYFEPGYEPDYESHYDGDNAWTEIVREIDAQDRERDIELSRDTWSTVNRTMNRELLEGTKPQRIEVVSARDGSVLRILEDVSEVAALMESMRTDDWKVVPASSVKTTPQYALVIYQQVNWPTGEKIEEVGRYLIPAEGNTVEYQLTLLPMGTPNIHLEVPAETAQLLLRF